jgi:hypothetical protein
MVYQVGRITMPSEQHPALRIGKYEIIDHLNTLSGIIGRSNLSNEEKHSLLDEIKRTKQLVNNL